MSFFQIPDFSLINLTAIVIILVLFSLLSLKKQSLSRFGIVFGNVVGVLVFLLGGMTSFLVIVTFFVIAEFCTNYSRKKTKQKHEQRTTANIVGNSGAAIIALFLGHSIGFFGAIAAALSDTVSSEIGMLSKKNPKLITSFKEVPIGTDGGITPIGLVSGIIGAALIAAICFYLTQTPVFFVIILVAGFSGSLMDSYLGAIFERKNLLNNMQVNFLASLTGALIAILLTTMS